MVALLLSPICAPNASAQTLKPDGSIQIGERTLRCGDVKTVLDRSLPMEGAAVLGEALVLNPLLLQRHSAPVRTFIYFHECAHHTVGGSELGADCWAVDRGVRDGWLDRPALDSVCRSFANEPESETHPSGAARCRNLNVCYADATKRWQSAPPTAVAQAKPQVPALPPIPARAPPRLITPPVLVSVGVVGDANEKHGLRAMPRFASDDAVIALTERAKPH